MKNLILLSALFTSLVHAQELPVVSNVDLNKYLGKWYEIASIPQSFQKQCVGNVSAEYSTTANELIKVLNSCDTADGKRDSAEGRARVVDTVTNAKLKVTFVHFIDWIFSFGGDYWIVDLAPDYSYSVVGHPDRTYAWILSRTPSMDQKTLIDIDARLKTLGYDTCLLMTTIQTGGLQEKRPLCQLAAN